MKELGLSKHALSNPFRSTSAPRPISSAGRTTTHTLFGRPARDNLAKVPIAIGSSHLRAIEIHGGGGLGQDRLAQMLLKFLVRVNLFQKFVQPLPHFLTTCEIMGACAK